ncbi:MAG TPA: hypothetical protein VGN16_24035 [Acidobacteriaceae bacterium]|jgi:hypothetical protein
MKRLYPIAVIMLLAAPALARAATLSPTDCLNDPNSPSCGINSVLHLLYAAAVVLGIALIVVILLAVNAWRKSKRSELDKQ